MKSLKLRNLGGNLYGSKPDSSFATEALAKIDFTLYLNTTLNQGHLLGRGKKTLILPVMAEIKNPSLRLRKACSVLSGLVKAVLHDISDQEAS